MPEDADAGPPRMPTWVKAFIVAGIVIAIAALIILVAGGTHGPGRHAP